MSSLDELILFNSAFWREEGMLDGTMPVDTVHCTMWDLL